MKLLAILFLLLTLPLTSVFAQTDDTTEDNILTASGLDRATIDALLADLQATNGDLAEIAMVLADYDLTSLEIANLLRRLDYASADDEAAVGLLRNLDQITLNELLSVLEIEAADLEALIAAANDPDTRDALLSDLGLDEVDFAWVLETVLQVDTLAATREAASVDQATFDLYMSELPEEQVLAYYDLTAAELNTLLGELDPADPVATSAILEENEVSAMALSNLLTYLEDDQVVAAEDMETLQGTLQSLALVETLRLAGMGEEELDALLIQLASVENTEDLEALLSQYGMSGDLDQNMEDLAEDLEDMGIQLPGQ